MSVSPVENLYLTRPSSCFSSTARYSVRWVKGGVSSASDEVGMAVRKKCEDQTRMLTETGNRETWRMEDEGK